MNKLPIPTKAHLIVRPIPPQQQETASGFQLMAPVPGAISNLLEALVIAAGPEVKGSYSINSRVVFQSYQAHPFLCHGEEFAFIREDDVMGEAD